MVSAPKEQLKWSSFESWTKNFSTNSQGGLAKLYGFTLLDGPFLMVCCHVTLLISRNGLLTYPQMFPHALPLAFQQTQNL